MSMNLTCHEGKKEINLWQTPTYITWMCLSYHPETKAIDGGHEGVRRRYLLWIESQLQGRHESQEDLDHLRSVAREHIETIQKLKNPKFSYI